MALPDRTYTRDYGQHAYTAPASYPERERRIRIREREKLNIAPVQPVPQQPAKAESILTRAMLAKTIAVLIFAGILLIGTVFLTAKATEIKYSVNTLSKQNAALQKEIDVLEVKIGSANSIESIEAYATEKLGMRYPKSGQCIYLDAGGAETEDLVRRIKEKAYRE